MSRSMAQRRRLIAEVLAGLACLPSGCLPRGSDSHQQSSAAATAVSAAPLAASGPLTPPSTDADALTQEGPCPDQPGAALRVIDSTHCEVPRAVFFADNNCLTSNHR